MDILVSLILWAVFSGVFGLIGGNIAKGKGLDYSTGFLLGAFLGLLGLLIVSMMHQRVPVRRLRRRRSLSRVRPRETTGRRIR